VNSVARKVWPFLSSVLVLHGLLSLFRDVAWVAIESVEFYDAHIRPFDWQGAFRAALLGTIDAYRAIVWPLLAWAEPALRDTLVVLGLIYGPQLVASARYVIGVRLLRENPNTSYYLWMEIRALITLAILARFFSIDLHYGLDALESAKYVAWLIPIYRFNVAFTFNEDGVPQIVPRVSHLSSGRHFAGSRFTFGRASP